MTNDADNLREMLSAYVDGELAQSDALRLELAMQKDPSLAGELAKLRKVVFMLRHVGREKAGEEFASRVMARAERANLVGGRAHASHHAFRPSLMFKWGAVAAAAVICIGAAALVHYVMNPGKGTGAAQLVVNDHKKDSHIVRSTPPSAAPGALTKGGGAGAGGAAHRDDLADARKPGNDYKNAEVATLDKDRSYLGAGEKLGDYNQKGAEEVLYTTNMDEERKNLEQVLACNGVGADAGTNNVAQSQYYNGTRNLSKAATGKISGDAPAPGVERNAFAYNGNFRAIQNNDNQVQYQVMANRSQLPQIRRQIDQLRSTSNVNANSVDGNRQNAGGQLALGERGQQGAPGAPAMKEASPACGPAGAASTAPAARICAPTGTLSGAGSPVSAPVSAKGCPGQALSPASQPASPAEINRPINQSAKDGLADATPGQKISPETQKALEGQERPCPSQTTMKFEEPSGQAQHDQTQQRESSGDAGKARVAQSADQAKKLHDDRARAEQQAQDAQSLEPLLITINVVAPANQTNAAAQKLDTAASSPATTTSKPAAESH